MLASVWLRRVSRGLFLNGFMGRAVFADKRKQLLDRAVARLVESRTLGLLKAPLVRMINGKVWKAV